MNMFGKLKEILEKIINRQSQLFTQYPEKFNILATQIPVEVNEVVCENNTHPILIGVVMMWLLKTFPPNPDQDLIVTALYITFVVFSKAEAGIHNAVEKYVAEGIVVDQETTFTSRGDCIGVVSVLLMTLVFLVTKSIMNQ